MFSRFFIDRPIFATVLSVVITLIGAIALASLPIAQYPRITPPGVAVSISYPGASAQVVADTVGAPIEQQVNGVPGMLYMSSQSANDGTYTLTVTFDVGTDLKTALVMVQNRVTLAMPQLPTEVQNQGITIRKKTPDILMIVNFFSPDGRYDDIYLSNYATIFVKDELLRVDGISDISYQGERDYSIRAWLDPQKLAAHNMTAIDVANAISNQNLDAPAGQIGQSPAPAGQAFQLPIDTLGRLALPEQYENIIVKVGQGRSTQPTNAASSGMSGSGGGGGSGSGGRSSGGSSGGMTAMSPTSATTNLSYNSLAPSDLATSATNTATSSINSTPDPSTSSSSTSSTSTTTTSTTTSTNSATTGGGTTGGGGGTGGGGQGGGGGTTGGGGTGIAGPGASSTLTVTSGTTGSGVLSASSNGRGPGRPSTAIVRLRDVARVEMGAQNYNLSCTFDGKPSVGLGLYQLPGTNALDVGDAVRRKMEELKTRFPEGVDYAIAYDTTPFIRESVEDVVKTLLEAVLLVGVVVLVFLQDWRAMILPMIDVPVSLIGTFAVMAALNYTLNNLTLFGLVLAIGIVVDDAIVVLENIERMIARGYDARTATIKAMDEVTGPIIAVALVLCAVFVPCAFIGGITGLFFRQFAVTISVSTVISAINAITMTPSRAVLLFKTDPGHEGAQVHRHEALPWWIFGLVGGILSFWLGPRYLAARFGLPGLPEAHAGLEPPRLLWWTYAAAWFSPGLVAGCLVGLIVIRPVNVVLGWFFRIFNRAFDGMSSVYGWIVGWSLRLSLIVLLIYCGLLVLTYKVFQRAPTGFIPQQDQGRLIVNIQLPDSSSLQRTQEATAKIVEITSGTEGVDHTVAIAGLSFLLQADSPNFASMFVVLKPFAERQKPHLRDTAIMAKLRKEWAKQVEEAKVTVYGASPVPGLGVAGGFKLIVEDRGDLGLTSLQKQTDAVVAKLRDLPSLSSVATQFRSKTPQIYLDIDRTKVASLGVSLDDVNQTLDMYLGSLYVNSFNAFGRDWQVTIQAEGDFRDRIEDLNLYQVRNNAGQMVPLGTLVKPRDIGGPISVTRYNLYTAASINGNVQNGFSTGDAINEIERLSGETLPLSMKSEWTELMFMQIRAGNTAMYVFLLGIVCVFLALAALYESWSLPMAVILVVPLCLLCSVSGVLLTNRDVNIFVQIGLVVLVGLACKNAILIVEYSRQLHHEGRSVFAATVEASRLRLRPILMTSFAFILGVVPLVIASGAGAEMRRSLGTAVFSGMIGVTAFGIFLTPVFFFVILGLGETRLFEGNVVKWVISCTMGGLVGLAAGFLLAKLGVGRLFWMPPVGAAAGLIVAISALEIRRRMAPPTARQVTPGLNGHAQANGHPAVSNGHLTGITDKHPSGDRPS
jgi:multidrug efflux pump